MKPALNNSSKVVEISKYVFVAGVLAGTCYGSLKNLTNQPVAKPPQPEPPLKARAAVA
jgi:hypothetical protein